MLPRPRIAVVDDDPYCLEIVRELLEDEGFEVLTHDDVRGGYLFIQERQPDLAIMDLVQARQPVGLGLLSALREDLHLRRLPTIVVSADANRLQRLGTDFAHHPAFATLHKPFDLQEMLEMVRRLLFDTLPAPAARA
jgi:DNA-binding response OmpR family regulator